MNRAELDAILATTAAEVAVAYRPLDGSDQLLINAETPFHAASTMKIPVMVDLFRQVEAGHCALSDEVAVVNQFKSIANGSTYKVELEHDAERPLFEREKATLLELCEQMITVSSNLATNLLIDFLGVTHIQATLHDLGLDDLKMMRGVEDSAAFAQGINNTTTAAALMKLLTLIATHRVLTPAACDAMLDILKRQEWRDGIPMGLPAGTVVAHKTGEITEHHHDAAIVYGERPYVLVILTRGYPDRAESAALITQIARAAHTHTA